MTNISYIGHDKVLDQGLEKQITSNIKKLLSQDDSFSFYFFRENEFSSCIKRVVQKLKTKRKDLQIKTILVETHNRDDEEYKKYDEIMVAPNLLENVHFMINVKRAQRWIIEQADYLFMYQYPGVDLEDQLILTYIRNQVKAGQLSIIDLTSDSTVSLINEQVPQLRERLRFVHEEIMSGKTFNALAKEMSITPARVRGLYNESCRKLYVLTYHVIKNGKLESRNEEI